MKPNPLSESSTATATSAVAYDYDLAVVGGGPGGYETALYAASLHQRVILFEANKLGGTCLHVGCIPTKTLCHEAETLLLAPQECRTSFSYEALLARRDAVVSQLATGVQTLLRTAGVTVVEARASLIDPHTLSDGTSRYTVAHVVLATGSVPAQPPIAGAEYAITSNELLSRTDPRPQRLCIVGAGVIGMEIASAYQAFGTDVTVVEFLKECLPPVDADIAKRLRKQLEKRGVKFLMNAQVSAVDSDRTVHLTQKGKELVVEADTVLLATGRRPNYGGIDLDALGIQHDRRGITVDDNMQTSVPGLYAIGDVNGRTMLAHAAKYQGMHAVNHLLHRPDAIRLDLIPSAVFTLPEVGSVGPTEQALEDSGTPYSVHKSLYRANGKALTMGQTDGIVKYLLDVDGQHILGCHVMGPHAADLVQEVTVAMNAGLTLQQLRQVVHIHPTLSEILVS